jgi:hypothetical protein
MTTPLRLASLVDDIREDLPHPIADPYSARYRFVWLPASVQAAFSGLTDTVYINKRYRAAEPEYLVGVVAHELHHAYQWQTQKLRYLAGKLYRPLIERTADEVEKAGDKLMGLEDLL